MSLIAELNLHGDQVLFGETFERVPDAECVFEDVHYVTDEREHTYYVFFWWASGCSFEAFERALQADATARDVRPVVDLDERQLYRVTSRKVPPDQPLVFPTFRELDVTTVDSVRDADGLHVRARFPTRDALGRFREIGTKIADNVDVVRLYAEREDTLPGDVLTRKQRETLALALDRGYFETPSQVTLDELAAEFDVTPQTLSRHVRVGVRKLLESSLERTDKR